MVAEKGEGLDDLALYHYNEELSPAQQFSFSCNYLQSVSVMLTKLAHKTDLYS